MARWAGPPRLLIAATFLGVVVSPVVSGASTADAAPAAQAALSAASTYATNAGDDLDPTDGDAEQTEAQSLPPPQPRAEGSIRGRSSDSGRASRPSESEVGPQLLGVASFNQFRHLSLAQARQDALELTSRPGVSVVGWQETADFGPVFQTLRKRGWETKRYRRAPRLAVSWRRGRFALVSSKVHRVARGVAQEAGRYPFYDRHVLRVTLRDKRSGQKLSVIDTHLPWAIEDLDRPGHWRGTINAARARKQLRQTAQVFRHAPGRWVVGTGDYNLGVVAESRVRPRSGLSRTFAGTAVSTYQELGRRRTDATHPPTGRWIDYVHVRKSDLEQGRVRVRGHRTLGNVSSDHRPLLAWLVLR